MPYARSWLQKLSHELLSNISTTINIVTTIYVIINTINNFVNILNSNWCYMVQFWSKCSTVQSVNVKIVSLAVMPVIIKSVKEKKKIILPPRNHSN